MSDRGSAGLATPLITIGLLWGAPQGHFLWHHGLGPGGRSKPHSDLNRGSLLLRIMKLMKEYRIHENSPWYPGAEGACPRKDRLGRDVDPVGEGVLGCTRL